MCVCVCIYCFISDPYPVYLMEAKAQCRNYLKVKAKGGEGGKGWRSASKRIPHVITHILKETHTHKIRHTHICRHAQTHSPRAAGRHGYLGTLTWTSWCTWVVKLHCTNTHTHARTHGHAPTHTFTEDQREWEPRTAALLLLPSAKWTTKHSRLSRPVISGLQPNEDGLCL